MTFSRFALPLVLFWGLGPASVAGAGTIIPPILTSAPTKVVVVNEFEDGFPSDRYTLSVSGVFETAEGAPELVGKGFSLVYRGLEADNSAWGETSLTIAGYSLAVWEGDTPLSLYVDFPRNGFGYYFEEWDVHYEVYHFDGPFSGFDFWSDGGFLGGFPYALLGVNVAGGDLPRQVGYSYCSNGSSGNCFFGPSPGLEDSFEEPVSLTGSFTYIEGSIPDTTVTFSTLSHSAYFGPADSFYELFCTSYNNCTGWPAEPPAPVPLPASGWLFAGALGLLGLRRRRR